MPNMCDSDFYEPIEGLPSVCEHLYTYYLWAPSGVSLPDEKHTTVYNWSKLADIITREKYPQISIDARKLNVEECNRIAKQIWDIGSCDVFIWEGGLRAKIYKEDL